MIKSLSKNQKINLGKRDLRQFGFTFFELIVVISIVAIVSGTVMVGYRTGQYRHELNNSAEGLSSDFRRAQNFSFAGKVPTPNDSTDVRYGLTTINNADYLIFRDLNGNSLYDGEPDDQIIEEADFAKSVRFFELSDLNKLTVTFPYPGEAAPMSIYLNSSEITTNYTISIYSDKSNSFREVVVERNSGVIKVN